MILLENQTDIKIDTSSLDAIAKSLSDRDIELILTDDIQIQALNRRYRGHDRATDVLSFPIEGNLITQPLGSIVISLNHVYKNANEYGHLPKEELALLFIHGMLHILGYDHEKDDGQMREIEAKLIRRFKLPRSLIVRSEGD